MTINCGDFWKWAVLFLGFFALIAAIQVAYFLYIFFSDEPLEPADAVIVFDGASARRKVGYHLVNGSWADRLIISPATREQLETYRKRYGLRIGPIPLIEEHAKNTFENALYTARLIRRHGFRNVILVTHDYHMPRSYLILRLLVGWDVRIQRRAVSNVPERSPAPQIILSVRGDLCREMVKSYGTLIQSLLHPLVTRN